MPAATPIRYTRLERLEAKKSYLEAEIRHLQTVRQYARRGERYRPFEPICGHREAELASRAAARATAERGRHVGFDEALQALRAGA